MASQLPRVDAATARQLDSIVALTRVVLGDDIVAAYLHGSAVDGGLKGSSDVDVLLVSNRRTTPGDHEALIQRLLPISGRRASAGPARSIELTIVVAPDIRPWRYPPRLDFQYGDWWRGEYERGDLEPWTTPNPDLAILLTTALRSGVPLVGPPPAEVLPEIPSGDLRDAIRDSIADIQSGLDSDDDTRNNLLTLARMWMTRATGDIRPKDVAADWALARLPVEHRPALAHARDVYRGDAVEDWGHGRRGRVRPYADYVIERIREPDGE